MNIINKGEAITVGKRQFIMLIARVPFLFELDMKGYLNDKNTTRT
jgi:hypothetical protein